MLLYSEKSSYSTMLSLPTSLSLLLTPHINKLRFCLLVFSGYCWLWVVNTAHYSRFFFLRILSRRFSYSKRFSVAWSTTIFIIIGKRFISRTFNFLQNFKTVFNTCNAGPCQMFLTVILCGISMHTKFEFCPLSSIFQFTYNLIYLI